MQLTLNLVASLSCVTLLACGRPGAEKPPPSKNVLVSGSTGVRSAELVEQALDRAQKAFLAGQWGDAVVQANQVVEGAASPEQYYLAVKIIGMASCNRKDPRPVAFAWSRLLPEDRMSLRNQCEQNGLTISDQGVVAPSP